MRQLLSQSTIFSAGQIRRSQSCGRRKNARCMRNSRLVAFLQRESAAPHLEESPAGLMPIAGDLVPFSFPCRSRMDMLFSVHLLSKYSRSNRSIEFGFLRSLCVQSQRESLLNSYPIFLVDLVLSKMHHRVTDSQANNKSADPLGHFPPTAIPNT